MNSIKYNGVNHRRHLNVATLGPAIQQQQQPKPLTHKKRRLFTKEANIDRDYGTKESETIHPHQKQPQERPATIEVSHQYLLDQRRRPGIYSGTIETTSRLPHGHGTMFYADGSEFTGSWFKGDWSGFGQHQCSKTKASFQGNFLDNIKNGLFVVKFNDGRLYDGEYQMDYMGKGVMKFPNGATYWGHFDDSGRPHGRGKLVMHNGRQYDGEFVQGVIEGHGRMTYSKTHNDGCDSTFYLGSFSNNKRDGLGVLVVDEVVVHDGLWYNDEPIESSSVASNKLLGVVQPTGTCQRLLGRIPKVLTPCSRLTKRKLTKKRLREQLGSSSIARQ